MPNSPHDMTTLRSFLAAAGIERSDAELEALLPWFKGRRESAEQVRRIDLGNVPVAAMFSPEWREDQGSDPSPAPKEANS